VLSSTQICLLAVGLRRNFVATLTDNTSMNQNLLAAVVPMGGDVALWRSCAAVGAGGVSEGDRADVGGRGGDVVHGRVESKEANV